jgi:exonuclease SbcD
MRLLHTADWHLGKVLKGVDRLPEQRAVLAEIVALAVEEAVDLVVVAGDVFESGAPPPEAQRLAFETLLALRATGADVVVVAGNHDNADAFEAVRPVFAAAGITVLGRACLPTPAASCPSPPARASRAPRPAALHLPAGHRAGRRPVQGHRRRRQRPLRRAPGQGDPARRGLRQAPSTCSWPTARSPAPASAGASGGAEHLRLPRARHCLPPPATYVALGHLHRTQEVPARCPAWYWLAVAVDFGEEAPRRRCSWWTRAEGAGAVRRIELTRPGSCAPSPGRSPSWPPSPDASRRRPAPVVVTEPARAGLGDEVRPAAQRHRRPGGGGGGGGRRAGRAGRSQRHRAVPPVPDRTRLSTIRRSRPCSPSCSMRQRPGRWVMRPSAAHAQLRRLPGRDRGRLRPTPRCSPSSDRPGGEVDGDRRHLLRPLRQRAPPRREGGRRGRVGGRQRGRRRAHLQRRRPALRRGPGGAPDAGDGRATTKEARLERHGPTARSRRGRAAGAGPRIEASSGWASTTSPGAWCCPRPSSPASCTTSRPTARTSEQLLGLGLYDVLVKQANQRSAEGQAAAGVAERAWPSSRRPTTPPGRRPRSWGDRDAGGRRGRRPGRPRPAAGPRPRPPPTRPHRRRWSPALEAVAVPPAVTEAGPAAGRGPPRAGRAEPARAGAAAGRRDEAEAARFARRPGGRGRGPPHASAPATRCGARRPPGRGGRTGPRRRPPPPTAEQAETDARRPRRRAGGPRRPRPGPPPVAGQACPVASSGSTVPAHPHPALRRPRTASMAAERVKRAPPAPRRRGRRRSPPDRRRAGSVDADARSPAGPGGGPPRPRGPGRPAGRGQAAADLSTAGEDVATTEAAVARPARRWTGSTTASPGGGPSTPSDAVAAAAAPPADLAEAWRRAGGVGGARNGVEGAPPRRPGWRRAEGAEDAHRGRAGGAAASRRRLEHRWR